MPQMNPIWWMNLFMFFILTFLLTNSLNYFFMTPSPSSFSKKFLKKTVNWKW